jgi:hypothetical protein
MDNFDPEKIPGWTNDDAAAESATPENAEPAPAEPVAAAEPTPAESDLDKLLEEFDAAQTTPGALGAQAQPEPTSDELDQLLRELDQPSAAQQLSEADAKIAAARSAYEAEAQRHKEEMALNEWCASWQERCPDWCPPDYFRNSAIAAALQDPRLEVAFRAAVNNVDRRAARNELDRVSQQVQQAKLTPGVDQNLIQNAQRYLWQLECAIHRDQILAQASNRIVNEARKNQPFDPEATGVRAMVNAAILRGASTSTPPEEPAPNYNAMTDYELRKHTQEKYGFAAI